MLVNHCFQWVTVWIPVAHMRGMSFVTAVHVCKQTLGPGRKRYVYTIFGVIISLTDGPSIFKSSYFMSSVF